MANITTDANKPKSEPDRSDNLKKEAQSVDPRERLSAYFTIVAAAFGLISDGCATFLCSFNS